MVITMETKRGDELANLICEVDAMIKDGSIKVGAFGLSPNAAETASLFNECLSNPPGTTEVNIIDNPIKLTTDFSKFNSTEQS